MSTVEGCPELSRLLPYSLRSLSPAACRHPPSGCTSRARRRPPRSRTKRRRSRLRWRPTRDMSRSLIRLHRTVGMRQSGWRRSRRGTSSRLLLKGSPAGQRGVCIKSVRDHFTMWSSNRQRSPMVRSLSTSVMTSRGPMSLISSESRMWLRIDQRATTFRFNSRPGETEYCEFQAACDGMRDRADNSSRDRAGRTTWPSG